MLFCHQYTSTSNLFQWKFHKIPSWCISQFQNFYFSHNLLFFKVFFFHTFWILLNSSVIVTNDTFNTWLSCLAKFTLYCCNKVSSQIIFEPNIEFFYLTMKQEKDWTQKLMITKCLYLKFQENFKISFCISANDLFINT